VPNAVVTGAASGLGAAISARLTTDGWEVVGVDLQRADIEADLATPEGRESMVAQVRERCGDRIDGVVACAGVGPHVADRSLLAAVNFFGAVATLDLLFPLLCEGTTPAAVAIASNSMGIVPPDEALLASCLDGDEAGARRRAAEIDGATSYGTGKRALAFAVRRRAQPWGERGVRLNAVAPGPTDTPMLQATIDDPQLGPSVDLLPIPLGRHGRPEEIAAAVAFLLSAEASLVHGSTLWADGGMDAAMRPEVV
jgi:3alpha-hydroxysteroid 3-dehydrogenase